MVNDLFNRIMMFEMKFDVMDCRFKFKFIFIVLLNMVSVVRLIFMMLSNKRNII